jgi:hypothetical protein
MQLSSYHEGAAKKRLCALVGIWNSKASQKLDVFGYAL